MSGYDNRGRGRGKSKGRSGRKGRDSRPDPSYGQETGRPSTSAGYEQHQSTSAGRPSYSRPSTSGGPSSYEQRPSTSGDRSSYAHPSTSGDRPSYAHPSTSGDRPSYAHPSTSGDRPSYAHPSTSGDRPSYPRTSGGPSTYPRTSKGPSTYPRTSGGPSYAHPSTSEGASTYAHPSTSAGPSSATMPTIEETTASGAVQGAKGKHDPVKGKREPKQGDTEAEGPAPRPPRKPRKFDSKEAVKTKPEACVTKCGVTGNRVELVTNYFKLESVPNWVIYQYRVDFNVDEDREGPRKLWLREHAERIGKAYIFDGTLLFTARRLTAEDKDLTLTSLRESDNFPVLITIRLVKALNYGDIIYIQIFNILLRRCLAKLDLQVIRRNYFDAGAAVRIPQYNLEIWPGYTTAIKQHERDILLCTEIAHKVLRTDTALQLLAECTRQGGDYQRLYKQSLLGEIVLTDYNNKTYRVDDIDFDKTPMHTFKLSETEEITFVDYYERRYRIKIRDMKQPLLVSRASARAIRGGSPNHCLLVPELCRMTGLSDKMRENGQLMKIMSEHTRVNPQQRVEKLYQFRSRLRSKPEILGEFDHWDLRLGRELLTVDGRELPIESLVGGRESKYGAGNKSEWSKEVRCRPMLLSARLDAWAIICPLQVKTELMKFLELLRRSATNMNFRMPPPIIFDTDTDRPGLIMEAVEEIMTKHKPSLIMFICLNNRSDRYNAIKKKCYVDRGVQSQVILARTLRAKALDSIACKVAIQINCKIGGAPWTVEIPMDGVMVVGYDACHDTTSKGRSYGAVVASLNKALSCWFSSVSHHSSGEELSNTLASDVWKALNRYRELNKSLPARIFVYRDGVGEGQVNYVFEHEVVALKRRLTEMYGGETWKMAYIIVSKRIKTRFFNGDFNPRAGTVVDDVVTLPERYDFYLVSQSVNSGTVTPTNYNIISDNLELPADKIQRWTYKMTHLYYNWTGTVRVPAPCQYAHKLAFLVSQSLHVQPHLRLDTTLYFL